MSITTFVFLGLSIISTIGFGNTLEECQEVIATINNHQGSNLSLECLNSYNIYFFYRQSGCRPEVFYITSYNVELDVSSEWRDLVVKAGQNSGLNNVYIRNKYHYPSLFTIAATKLTQTQDLLCQDLSSSPAIQVCCVYEKRKRRFSSDSFVQPTPPPLNHLIDPVVK